MSAIDLNADVGESFGAYKLGCDQEVMKYITSANIACGMHAGDPAVMGTTTALAVKIGVCAGAHPGYPDLQGFGRRNISMSLDELKYYVIYQIGSLMAFCQANGTKLSHVKPHGALYNMAVKNADIARAIVEAVKAVDPNLILLALSGSEMVKAARSQGLPVAREVFADRAYNPDGTLVSRGCAGAMIDDPEIAASRIVRMVNEGKVKSITGADVSIVPDSVCVHGDNPQVLEFIKRIRLSLQEAGIKISPLPEITGIR